MLLWIICFGLGWQCSNVAKVKCMVEYLCMILSFLGGCILWLSLAKMGGSMAIADRLVLGIIVVVVVVVICMNVSIMQYFIDSHQLAI